MSDAKFTRSISTAGALLFLLLGRASAGPRTSANYSITTDTVDAGGMRTTSAAYANDGSAGAVAGLSTVAAPVETVKAGYIGQLYNATGLSVTAPGDPATVNGGATLQLSAWEILDDASFLGVAPALVTWSVVAGPISGISSGGLATGSAVYQDTAASVQGIYAGFTGSLGITVTDLNNDSFGIYANDGIDDSWQVEYFGLGSGGAGNPLGLANVDADGTGQPNLFKFLAGLNPIDPSSRFVLTIQPAGQTGQTNLVFGPLVSGRTYTVTATSSLSTSDGWSPITASPPSDNGQQRTITDLSATGPAKFYRVEISKP